MQGPKREKKTLLKKRKEKELKELASKCKFKIFFLEGFVFVRASKMISLKLFIIFGPLKV